MKTFVTRFSSGLLSLLLLAGQAPSLCSAATHSPAPPPIDFAAEEKILPSATPEKMGVDPKAIEAMIAHLDQVESADATKEPPFFIKDTLGGHGLHSLLIMRHGKLIYDYYRPPYTMDKPHFIWSCSKSFASLAVGFAVQEGKLDIHEKLADIFADRVAKFPTPPDERARKITVRNVLMMQTGHIGDAKPIPNRVTGFLLAKSPREPGTYFSYDTAGVCMLAYVIQAKTGEPLEKFLAKRLFEPLGIVRYDQWAREKPEGVVDCGAGLSLRPRDLAKVGLFLMNKGKWDGKQLLNEEWIKDATTAPADATNSYGYLFWVRKGTNSFYMLGNNGQHLFVMPDYDMLIVTTAQFKDGKAVIDAVYDRFLPTVKG